MIVSSRCSPVYQRASIVSDEHEHELRTRSLYFACQIPGQIGHNPENLSSGVIVGGLTLSTITHHEHGSSPVHDHGSFFRCGFDHSFFSKHAENLVTNILRSERIERLILLIRGCKVMLDADLAELYGVETRVLLQAVSRNQKRFPKDFMFQLSKEEYELLRSQIVISKKGRGGRRYLPYAFTDQ